jgi:hypothetical protein
MMKMKIKKLNEASEDHYLVDWEMGDFEYVFLDLKIL